ncbi:hypothetical protein O181_070293 [Austropuccinia psidii MF-1]|uniref:Uncharacterized protein n=1 Tax=Austropuccinia psidii MF-1 TaxID=1389203 RepID=A0A9Q3F3N9_9BASI|nr:hypothetical protein [Austropuccinia psidii MF-1]
MSHLNRDKSHYKGSNRHIYDPVQALLHGIQGHKLGNIATNTPRRYELLAYSQKASQRGGNSEPLQGMESTIIQASNQKIKDWHNKRQEASKEKAPLASTSKPQASQPPQERKKNNKTNWKKP